MAGGTYGGLSPGFERYGGHRSDVLAALVDSIAQQRGTAVDSSITSNVYPENMAVARAIAEAWSNLDRMANQWDSARMTDFIPRWEKILGINPPYGATDVDRRARIAIAFARATQTAVYRTIVDELTAALGACFVSIVTDSSSGAGTVVWTPAGWSMGTTDLTGLLNWYSTVALLRVMVTQPAGMADLTFYETVAKMNPILDTLLPAWVNWQWMRSSGFYLDTGYAGGVVPPGQPSVNLDNEGLT